MANIGGNIRALRKKKHLTQDELAEMLHVTHQTISNYETGKSKPDVETVEQLAAILEVDVQLLFYGENVPRNKLLIRQIWLGALIILVFIISLTILHSWVDQYTSRHYVMYPTLILYLLADPALAFLIGLWLPTLAVGVFKIKLEHWKIITIFRILLLSIATAYCTIVISDIINHSVLFRNLPGHSAILDFIYRFCSEEHILYCLVFTLFGVMWNITLKRGTGTST